MTILLTGSTGFIGSHIADYLTENHYDWRPFHGDITSDTDVTRNLRDVKTVIHLAAITFAPLFYDIPEITWRINTEGTLNILRNHKSFDYLVFFSSAHVYGNVKGVITEETIPKPLEPYSVSKLACEQLIGSFQRAFGDFNYTILRPFNNFGPRQNYKFAIPTFIKQALASNKIILKGDSYREFLYVKDTVEAVGEVIKQSPANKTYLISNGKTYLTSDVARVIARIVDPDNPCAVLTAPKSDRIVDIDKLEGSGDLILRELGWKPRYSLEDGLIETIEFYKDAL